MAILSILQLIDEYNPLVSSRIARITDPAAAQPYRFMQMLISKYSANGRFTSTTGKRTRFVMDLVALDSPLPLKKRDSVGESSGQIPKMGNKFTLNETEMDALDALVQRFAAVPDNTATTPPNIAALQDQQRTNYQDQVVSLLFGDSFKLTVGALERLEFDFLQALSTGLLLTKDEDETDSDVAIRIDYGYLPENKVDSVTAWNAAGSNPIEDIEALLSAARVAGKKILRLMMDRPTFNRLRTSEGGKLLFAGSNNTTVIDVANVKAPNFEQLNTALLQEYGFTIELVEKVSTFQRNGKNTNSVPWAAGAIVGLANPENVGTYQWTEVAEERRPVAGVTYTKPTIYSLVGMKRDTDPIAETTRFEAKICVVLENVDEIFLLDTLQTQG